MPEPEATDWLGTKQAAEKLGLSEARVRALARSGELPGKKEDGRWLFDPEALDRLEAASLGLTAALRSDATRLGAAMIATGPLIGATLYAYGWVVLARFYGHLGVSPGEVGWGFASMTVRVGLTMAACLLLIVLAVLAVSLKQNLAPGDWASTSINYLVVAGALLAGTGTYAGVADAATWVQWGATSLVGLGVGFLLFFVLEDVIQWAIDFVDAHPNPAALAGRALSAVLAVALVGVAAYFAVNAVPRMARDTAGSSHGFEYTALGVTLLRVPSVEVISSSAGPSDGCFLYLGASNGIAALFDTESRSTVRVSTDGLRVESPCSVE